MSADVDDSRDAPQEEIFGVEHPSVHSAQELFQP
jgi:hypothetical protein